MNKKVAVSIISIILLILAIFVTFFVIKTINANNLTQMAAMQDENNIKGIENKVSDKQNNEASTTNTTVNTTIKTDNKNTSKTENKTEKKNPNTNNNEKTNPKAENKNNESNKSNEKKVEYKKVEETVYALATVHIREEASTNSTIVATVSMGTAIKRIGIGNNGWSKIEYNKKVAYISTEYVSTQKPPEPEKVDTHIDSNRKIDPSKPMVALTFDDGPNPNSTPKILDALEKNKCVATFFDLGTCMSNYPDITRREEKIGCEVGSHTYAHKNLDNLTKEQILEDINTAAKIYKNTLGHELTLVRPPYGNANSKVKITLDYALINWDVDTMDWKTKNKDAIIKEVKKVGNLDGRIILMHSIYNSTAEAVAELLPQLKKEGYQLVTISELAKYKNIELKTHTAYWGFR